MSLSFGLKVRTVVKPSHVVRNPADPAAGPHQREALPMTFPPTESVAVSHPRRVRRAMRCSSWMTPMQHTRIRAYCQSARTRCNRTMSVYRAAGHAGVPRIDHHSDSNGHGVLKVLRPPLLSWYGRYAR